MYWSISLEIVLSGSETSILFVYKTTESFGQSRDNTQANVVGVFLVYVY